jgi:hypothetical protein
MAGLYRPHRSCRHCGLVFEREEGFFLGALALNYGALCVGGPGVGGLLWLSGAVSPWTALVCGALGALITPFVFYPWSRSLNLALYYLFFPEHLQVLPGEKVKAPIDHPPNPHPAGDDF